MSKIICEQLFKSTYIIKTAAHLIRKRINGSNFSLNFFYTIQVSKKKFQVDVETLLSLVCSGWSEAEIFSLRFEFRRKIDAENFAIKKLIIFFDSFSSSGSFISVLSKVAKREITLAADHKGCKISCKLFFFQKNTVFSFVVFFSQPVGPFYKTKK